MKNLIKLFSDWEIQLLVLVSFTLQLFLFFVGNLRWRWSNMYLRFSTWMAYLGADLVAVYALGYLSRHVDATTGRHTLRDVHPLSFFWAPFLLVHLGGQDTITSFSMEDNNLWLRHSLNMVVQVVLALYIFWMSIGRHSIELLISGIFVFVAGVIKYGERIWSLNGGSMESLESSTGNQYKNQLFEQLPDLENVTGYYRTVCTGLHLMPQVLEVLTGRSSYIHINPSMKVKGDELLNLMGIELEVLHNDIYTKAVVVRSRSGIILRWISRITLIVSFVTFHIAVNKQSYHRADIAVTYSLFIGGFLLEVCAVFISLMSPWTFVRLRKALECNSLARFLFCNDTIGWSSEKRLSWSNVVGQFNLRGWLGHSTTPEKLPRLLINRHLMIMVRKLLTLLFGAQNEKIFWLSKLLGREFTNGDKIMECLRNRIIVNDRTHSNVGAFLDGLFDMFVYEIGRDLGVRTFDLNDFGTRLVLMHFATEQHLSQYGSSDMEIIRQLSRYMMYLIVTHPSLLPLDTAAVATLELFRAADRKPEFTTYLQAMSDRFMFHRISMRELENSWIWILMYAAAYSRPEIHAALLPRGELLTFVWLLLAHVELNDDKTSAAMSAMSWYRRIGRQPLDQVNTRPIENQGVVDVV